MAKLDQFGLDVGIYGPLAQPDTIIPLAQFAESAGFGSIWLADHVAFPVQIASRYPFSATGRFPAPTTDPLLEPIATMGVLVLVDVVDQQEAVRIGTNVAAIIGIGLVASLALMALFSLRSGSKHDE